MSSSASNLRAAVLAWTSNFPVGKSSSPSTTLFNKRKNLNLAKCDSFFQEWWWSTGARARARAIKRCGMQINQSRRNNDGPPGLTAPSICIYTRRRSFCNFSKTHTRTKQRQTPFSQESKTCDFCRIPAHFITKIFRTWHGKSRAFYKLFFPFSTNKKKGQQSLSVECISSTKLSLCF